MDKKRLIFVAGLVVVAVALAVGGRGQAPDAIQPVTITYSEVHYGQQGSEAPNFTRTEIVGVRSDGSVSRATFHGATGEHPAYFILKITEPSQGKHVVVDQFTESTTTYASPGLVDQYRIKPASACPGQPGDPILGFATFVEEKTLKVPGNGAGVKAWRAPRLNCLPLREEIVRTRGGGTSSLQVTSAISITLGEPGAWLFDIPRGYTERTPNEVLAEAAKKAGRPAPPAAPGLDAVYSGAQGPKKP